MSFSAQQLLADESSLNFAANTMLNRFRLKAKKPKKLAWQRLEQRLQAQLPTLLRLYLELYRDRYDWYFHFEQLLQLIADNLAQRPEYLQQADERTDPWFLSEQSLGAACYVDLFADDFSGLIARIPYLQQAGITYLHLMPLFKAPEPDSDGGYAVSDYRQTAEKLGSMAQLAELMATLHQHGIRPVLDFVFNHTSDEHRWAELAKQGDAEYRDYYFFLTETERDQYAPHLREIFPEIRRGCFTQDSHSDLWIWTTFNSFQWDLNYANPAVFNAMAAEMLFLANQGAAVLRLDALAFVWKEVGTCCENLPKAHQLIQAFNAVARIAAPALQFKSEAIVHPDEVVKYIAAKECQLSYNPLLMALLWESLATRQTRLLTQSLQHRFSIAPDCGWVNYIRCHDDIGWTFDDDIAWQLGINPHHHRQFLNQFYTGQFAGSFAVGVPFQQNPVTGDCRVAGMLASLAGVEQALTLQEPLLLEHAIARIYLLHSIIFSIGGLPLLYLGDELGLLNDYSYQQDPTKWNDSRWVNRVKVDSRQLETATQQDTLSGHIYSKLQHLLQIRRKLPVLGSGRTEILSSDNPHVFCYSRQSNHARLLCVINFSEHPQNTDLLGTGPWYDELTNFCYQTSNLVLQPYQVVWLTAR